MQCPCGSNNKFELCCEPFLKGTVRPETAEQLMRSRYTAYTKADIYYIVKTLAPEARKDFDKKDAQQWATKSKWKGLKILSTEKGGPNDTDGTVEFVATYSMNGEGVDHHEVSTFRREKDGQWLFVDGHSHTHPEGEGHHHHAPIETHRRDQPKIGRNDPCPCGSGKKYKKCCGATA